MSLVPDQLIGIGRRGDGISARRGQKHANTHTADIARDTGIGTGSIHADLVGIFMS
jgi:hypothetical protein